MSAEVSVKINVARSSILNELTQQVPSTCSSDCDSTILNASEHWTEQNKYHPQWNWRNHTKKGKYNADGERHNIIQNEIEQSTQLPS